MEQIARNVYVDTDLAKRVSPHGCSYGFVVTSAGIVLIDTPMLPTDAMRCRAEIASRGEVSYIINTEFHLDHIAGNYFFPGTVVSHQGVRDMIITPTEEGMAYQTGKSGVPINLRDRALNRFRKSDPEGLALARDFQPRPPTITFSERLTLYVGDHTFELIHLPGHVSCQLAVYIPQERVVFTGDNFTNEWQATMWNSCPLEWLESLKTIEALDVDYIVPGHGPAGDKAAVREFSAFIQGAIDTVRQAIRRGMTREEAANTISFESLRPARHAGEEQQRLNVLRLYEMLSK